MHRTILGALFFAALAILAGCGSEASECTPENCAKARDSCQWAFSGDPIRACFELHDPAEELDTSYCVATCRERRMGPVIGCLASNAAACEEAAPHDSSRFDEEAFQQIRSDCNVPPAPDRHCATFCSQNYRLCTSTCPTDAWASCSECASACGRALEDCLNCERESYPNGPVIY